MTEHATFAQDRPAQAPAPKVERSDNLIILTFTAHAIRNVESVIARELAAVADGTGSKHLLLDCTHIEQLNSMELSTLVTLHKRVRAAGGRLTLFNLSAQLFQMFSITRLDTLIEICCEDVAGRPGHRPGATDRGPRPGS